MRYYGYRRWRDDPHRKSREMKKAAPIVTAAMFALGLVSAGLAQTVQTPKKPAVKTATPAAQTPAGAWAEVAKPESAKPGEKGGAKEVVKPGEAKKETKKETRKEAKQVRAEEKKSAAPERSQPEKK
jgi:hypothetical protein